MIDRQGRSGLHYPETEQQALELLEAGEDVNLQDREGFAPLHMAAEQGNVAVARLLLARGAAVDAVNKFGNTALWVAIANYRSDGEMIELLRTAGADPRKRNNTGKMPVEFARKIANYDVAKFFTDV